MLRFPMGAVPKPMEPGAMRPFSDHTKTLCSLVLMFPPPEGARPSLVPKPQPPPHPQVGSLFCCVLPVVCFIANLLVVCACCLFPQAPLVFFL